MIVKQKIEYERSEAIHEHRESKTLGTIQIPSFDFLDEDTDVYFPSKAITVICEPGLRPP
jgi:hypothetical protein